jgi:hypothetical protein
MFDRLKKNKGYYSMLLADTVAGSVIVGVQFALLNLPLAVVISIVNFAANIVAGVAMTPKQGQAPVPAESAAAVSDEPEPSSFKKFRTYQKSLFYNPDYISKSAASGAGITMLFEAILGMKSVLATHSILFLTGVAPPVGIAVGAVMAAIALHGIIGGHYEKWKGISECYTAVFKKGSAGSSPKKAHNGFLKKRPRLQKFLNRPWLKKLNKYTLMAMTANAAIFTLIAAPTIMARHITAMTSATGLRPIITGIVDFGIALNWVRSPAWHAICIGWVNVRDVFHAIKSKVTAKKTAAERTAEPQPESAPVPQPAPPAPDEAPVNEALPEEVLTAAFDKVADKGADQKTGNVSPATPANKQRRPVPGTF